MKALFIKVMMGCREHLWGYLMTTMKDLFIIEYNIFINIQIYFIFEIPWVMDN